MTNRAQELDSLYWELGRRIKWNVEQFQKYLTDDVEDHDGWAEWYAMRAMKLETVKTRVGRRLSRVGLLTGELAGGLTDRGTYRGATATRTVKGKTIEVKLNQQSLVLPDDVVKINKRLF